MATALVLAARRHRRSNSAYFEGSGDCRSSLLGEEWRSLLRPTVIVNFSVNPVSVGVCYLLREINRDRVSAANQNPHIFLWLGHVFA